MRRTLFTPSPGCGDCRSRDAHHGVRPTDRDRLDDRTSSPIELDREDSPMTTFSRTLARQSSRPARHRHDGPARCRRHRTERRSAPRHAGFARAVSPRRLCVSPRRRHVRVPLCGCVPGRLDGGDHRARRRPAVGLPPRPIDGPARSCSSNTIELRSHGTFSSAEPTDSSRTTSSQRADGIRVASPPRAWFDCARDIDDERFERLTEWVLDQHTTMPTLCGAGRVNDATWPTRSWRGSTE